MVLRQQLSMYTDKYDDFQKALTASNRTFVGFKDQMDTMTKKLKSLEKETASWKQRWESSNKALIDMATEKKQRDSELANATKQLAQLEKLCRALQTERTALIGQLKDHKSEVTKTSPESPPPPPPPPAPQDAELANQEIQVQTETTEEIAEISTVVDDTAEMAVESVAEIAETTAATTESPSVEEVTTRAPHSSQELPTESNNQVEVEQIEPEIATLSLESSMDLPADVSSHNDG